MTTNGGGWTLIGIITNADGENWNKGSARWVDTTDFGNPLDPTTNADAKSKAWNRLQVDEVMIVKQGTGVELQSNDECFPAQTMRSVFRRNSQNDSDCALSCGTQVRSGPWAQDRTDSTLRFRCMDTHSSGSAHGFTWGPDGDNSMFTTMNNGEYRDYNFGWSRRER